MFDRMVEADPTGDGVRRDVIYAKWRTDKPATEGYTQDLFHKDTPESCYDDFNKLPELQKSTKNIL